MVWRLTLLAALVGASGGLIGGWLSGRLGSRATLRAVREERAPRARVDYVAALAAFDYGNAACLSVGSSFGERSRGQPEPPQCATQRLRLGRGNQEDRCVACSDVC